MSTFQIGDTVETIDDVIKGTIISLSDANVTIEIDDGFTMRFLSSELVKTIQKDKITVSNYDVAKIKKEKELPTKRKQVATKPKERNAPKMEVDLHIHHLVPSTKDMTNHEMLNIQIDTAKRQLEFAIRKRIQKIVFIHGVGAGVLKEELHYLFGRYDVNYYDADYQKYGLGATEVYVFQNS
ncbi:DNA mismatch repair protein MutS [Costertonia aggregata]|uniref:DNA mismatch repair protein MutS n=1 Tax=Costertonia aggregata TaxID=343403 RepID=A0A7H9AT62_9FLAO|nr:DNA mismatch repair protein MutS [Costertonia aggregata]QLG46385.1 DNA mismatch repair protein MutS [Costertonia aggregata]